VKEKSGKIAFAIFLIPFVITILWGVLSHFNRIDYDEKNMKVVLERGLAVPDFSFPDLDGNIIQLSNFKGKVILLNIWASWCIPCLDEMPSLENLYQSLKSLNKKFEIVAVSIDALGADVVRKFVKKYKISFPVALDPRHKIKKLYSVKGVPETFVIDAKGMLIQKIVGPRKWDDKKTIEYFNKLTQ
tara:strand:+ start:51504 stop:52064 length:561 start_codon:yes stop_codon:yes gene_type:complete